MITFFKNCCLLFNPSSFSSSSSSFLLFLLIRFGVGIGCATCVELAYRIEKGIADPSTQLALPAMEVAGVTTAVKKSLPKSKSAKSSESSTSVLPLPAALILQCPMLSILSENKLASMFSYDPFDNGKKAPKISSPVIILHGDEDMSCSKDSVKVFFLTFSFFF